MLHDLPVPRPGNNIIHAARGGLESVLAAGTEGAGIGAVRGYVSQRLGDETTDPVVQVTRDGDVIAFAHVRGEGGASDPPWTTIETAEVCSEERAAAAEPDTNDTTTTERPDTQELPP